MAHSQTNNVLVYVRMYAVTKRGVVGRQVDCSILCCNIACLVVVCQCQSEFFTWLIVAVAISESPKAYKSREKQYYSNRSGKNLWKRNVFKCRRKIDKDGMTVHPKGESSM